MLQADDTLSFLSLLLLFFSVFRPFQSQKLFTSLLQPVPILFSHAVFLFFPHNAFGVFHPVWFQHSPTNAHNRWRCKSPLPLLTPSVRQVCWPGNFQGLLWQSRLRTDSDTFGGSATFATRGGEEQKPSVESYWLGRSRDFLLNWKIPSKRRIIASESPVRLFIIYLNIAWSVMDNNPSFARGMEDKEFISQDTSF